MSLGIEFGIVLVDRVWVGLENRDAGDVRMGNRRENMDTEFE